MVIQLGQKASELLQDAKTCRHKAAHLKTLLDEFTSRVDQLEDADVDVSVLESNMREIYTMLKPYFKHNRGVASNIIRLLNSRHTYEALCDAEQRLQTILQICAIDLALQNRARSIASSVDEEQSDTEEADLQEDHDHLVEMLGELRGQGRLDDSQIDAVLDLNEHQQQERLSITDVIQGRVGTEEQSEIVKLLLKHHLQEEHDGIVTLDKNMLTFNDPEEMLGHGRFGEVVGGVLRDEDGKETPVAIKRVRPSSEDQELIEERALIFEADGWQELQHPNIVCLLGACIIEEKIHLVMDHCDLSLRDLLRESSTAGPTQLSDEDKETIARSIVRGLDYLHGQGVIHRDLKPATVLLSVDFGLVKLSGFGLSTRTTIGTTAADTLSAEGTSLYMAPEVMTPPARWTTRADIYSLGLILWEIYNAQTPYMHVGSVTELESRVMSGERPSISEEIVTSKWLVQIIQQCWQHDPKQRPRASRILKRFLSRGKSSRRSTRIIRGLVATITRSRFQSTSYGEENEHIQQMQDLLRDIAEAEDLSDTGESLKALHAILQKEYEVNLSESVRSEACTRGVLTRMRRVLSDEDLDPSILAEAMWILTYALSGRGNAILFREAAVRDYHFGESILEILRGDIENVDLQTAGCAILMTLAHSPARNQQVLGIELNACQDLYEIMQAHPSNADVQQWACGALWNLAMNSSNREFMALDLNVGQVILEAMQFHEKNLEVLENACWALYNLAQEDSVKEILCQQGAVAEVQIAHRRYPTLRAADQALERLVENQIEVVEGEV